VNDPVAKRLMDQLWRAIDRGDWVACHIIGAKLRSICPTG